MSFTSNSSALAEFELIEAELNYVQVAYFYKTFIQLLNFSYNRNIANFTTLASFGLCIRTALHNVDVCSHHSDTTPPSASKQ